jgi:hypothetical protein
MLAPTLQRDLAPAKGAGRVPISSQRVPPNLATTPPDHQRQGKKVIPGPATKSPAFGDGINVTGLSSGFTAAVPSPETIDAVRAAVTPSAIRGYVARVSGADPLVDGKPGTVRSRNAATGDNMLVVAALARTLHDLGLVVSLHQFSWRGHRLANVEAEHRVAGSDGAVLVTAHLDSTAAEGEFVDSAGRPRDYDPQVDPARGADDDGSGMAAVMAAAECLATLVATGRAPTRTLRFLLSTPRSRDSSAAERTPAPLPLPLPGTASRRSSRWT